MRFMTVRNDTDELVELTTLIPQFIRTIVCRGTTKCAEEHNILGVLRI